MPNTPFQYDVFLVSERRSFVLLPRSIETVHCFVGTEYLDRTDEYAASASGKTDSMHYFPPESNNKQWTGSVGIYQENNALNRFRSEEHTSELQSRGHIVCG